MISAYQFLANHPKLTIRTTKPTVFAEDPVYRMDLGTHDNTAHLWFFRIQPPKDGLTAVEVVARLAEQFRSVAGRCRAEDVPLKMSEALFTCYANQLHELLEAAGDQFVDELLQVEPLQCHGS